MSDGCRGQRVDRGVGTPGSPTARPVSSPAGSREGPAPWVACARSPCHPEAAVDAWAPTCSGTGRCVGPVTLERRSPASLVGAWRKRAVGPPPAEARAERRRLASAHQTAWGRPAPRGRAGRWPLCRWERASRRGVPPVEWGCRWEQLGSWGGEANQTGLRCGSRPGEGRAGPGDVTREAGPEAG